MSFSKKIILSFVVILLVIFGFRNGSLFTKSQTVSGGNFVPALATSSQNMLENKDFSLITEPADGITPIVNAIKNAKTSADVVMYQMEDTNIEQALANDEARGVSVRVILNGGYYGVPDEPNENETAYQFLTSHNVPVHWSSSQFALTHQKSVVIDGATAFILTFNFTPQYYATSRDFALTDTDTNDISAITQTFDADWNDKNISPTSGDDLIWSPGSENTLISFIDDAQNSIYIYNEEMNDIDIVNALIAAEKAGVNVEVVMTNSAEWANNFKKLSAAGVKIGLYSPNAKLYIHAKMILIDNVDAFLGSENFSPTSLQNNRELGIMVQDGAVLNSLSAIFQKDFANAKQF